MARPAAESTVLARPVPPSFPASCIQRSSGSASPPTPRTPTRALLGTVGAYLAMLAWQRSVRILTHVPFLSLAVIIVGLPVVAAIAGWLLAGREPPAIARQPLE